MKNQIGFAILGLCLMGLNGCPQSLTPGNADNSLTLHNKGTIAINFFSITRDPTPEKTGINILPEPIGPGDSFSVQNLVDGIYDLYCYGGQTGHTDSESAQQSIEGGRHYDWYVEISAAKSATWVLPESGSLTRKVLDLIRHALFGNQAD